MDLENLAAPVCLFDPAKVTKCRRTPTDVAQVPERCSEVFFCCKWAAASP